MTDVSIAANNTGTVRMTAGERVGIPPRRMDFEFSADSEKYWLNGSPFLTLLVSALSTTFPAGETFFVDSVRHYRDQITDQKLKDEVTGFIGQEAMHSKEHMAFNHMMDERGLSGTALERIADFTTTILRKLPPKLQLSATCGMEHYTAAFAEYVLRNQELRDLFTDQKVLNLWLWHALEENEHKTVAYDVYNSIGGGYFTRILGMIVGSIALFGTVFVGHLRLMWEDGALFNFKDNAKGAWFAFGWKGVVHNLAGKLFDYFRPGFHPLDHDTVELLEEWREKMFNDGGILADQIKNPRRPAAA